MDEDSNLKYWEEQDAILIKHREEAYHIGGEEQLILKAADILAKIE